MDWRSRRGCRRRPFGEHGSGEQPHLHLARLEASGSLARIADTLPKLAQKLEMLERLLHAFEVAASKTALAPRAPGGIGGMWRLMSDPDNQDALRFLMNVGKELRARPPV